MMLDITLPALPGGAARVLRWLAADGAAVEAGAPLLIVLTEQAEVLLPAAAAGQLTGCVPEGTAVEPGAPLARLAPAVPISAGADAPPPTAAAAPPPDAGRVPPRATPLARRVAAAHGVELADLTGTGPRGCIVAADVRAALGSAAAHPAAPPAGPAAPPSPPAVPLSPTAPAPIPPTPPIPHSPTPPIPPVPHSPHPPIATATVELDAGRALGRVAELRGRFGQLRLPLGLWACVVEAAAACLPAHPCVNARWSDDGLVLRRRVHIAAAEPGPGGRLCWALVADAGDLTLRGVARALAAPAKALDPATFAVVSLADGAGWQAAVPPLPGTAAALSLGAPAARPVVVGDAVAVRPVAALTLSYDARVLDHSLAAAFLAAVKAALEQA